MISLITFEVLAINFQSFLTSLIVVHYWFRVLYSFGNVQIALIKPLMDSIIGHSCQLRNPLLYVFAFCIIVELLGPWIENSKIGLSISSVSDCPLPPC